VKTYLRFAKNVPPFRQKRTFVSPKTYLRFIKNVPPFYEKGIYEPLKTYIPFYFNASSIIGFVKYIQIKEGVPLM